MSVVVMLAWLWWGLLGFVGVAVNLWFFIKCLGPKGRLVFVLLVGTVGGRLIEHWMTADQRCADGFLKAWAAESADWPEGCANTRPWGAFVDYDKLPSPNPYLAQHWRLRRHSRAQAVGKEDVDVRGAASPVPAKVYLSDVRVHGSEHDVDFIARIRVWVAMDDQKVVRFEFEGIVFQ